VFLNLFEDSALIENLSWAIFHSVWQIAFIAFWLFCTLRSLSKSSANLRYAVSIVALSLTLIIPIATFSYISLSNFSIGASEIRLDSTSHKLSDKSAETSGIGRSQISAWSSAVVSIPFGSFRNSFNRIVKTYSPLLTVFWLIGMLLFSIRALGGFWQVHQFKTLQISLPDNVWIEKLSELSEKLQMKRSVSLFKSKLIDSPMIIGWIKPVILVPASIFLHMEAKQLETILAHELVHIRRFDYLINFAQSFVEILFFYHPFVWWISAEIRRERECACDDAVIQMLENSQFTYANALANLEEFRQTTKQGVTQIAVAANGGKLMNRIQRIIRKGKTKKSGIQNSLWSASLASALILVILTTVFWASVMADVNESFKKSDNNSIKPIETRKNSKNPTRPLIRTQNENKNPKVLKHSPFAPDVAPTPPAAPPPKPPVAPTPPATPPPKPPEAIKSKPPAKVKSKLHRRAKVKSKLHRRTKVKSKLHSRAKVKSKVHSRAKVKSKLHRRAKVKSKPHRRAKVKSKPSPSPSKPK